MPAAAFLFNRSTAYDHAATGRGYHLTSLAMLMTKAQRYRIINLPPERVFMSRHLNPFSHGRDKRNRSFGLSAALIEGHVNHGPALSIYGYYGGRLVLIARTPWHGDKNGWLALVKAFDLDFDGCPELTLVRDPQADGTLEISAVAARALAGRYPVHACQAGRGQGVIEPRIRDLFEPDFGDNRFRWRRHVRFGGSGSIPTGAPRHVFEGRGT